jgi:hypothetical protein
MNPGLFHGRYDGLALAELEAPPGAPLAVFFPFHHTGIPGKESVVPQGNNITQVNLAEGPGKAVPAGSRLAVGSAPVYIDKHIEFIFAGGYHQGLADHHGMFALGKILGQLFAVDGEFSRSVPDIYPGHGGFPSAGADSKILYHNTTSFFIITD